MEFPLNDSFIAHTGSPQISHCVHCSVGLMRRRFHCPSSTLNAISPDSAVRARRSRQDAWMILIHQHFLQRPLWLEAGIKFPAQPFEFMGRFLDLAPAHHHRLRQQPMLERVHSGHGLAVGRFRGRWISGRCAGWRPVARATWISCRAFSFIPPAEYSGYRENTPMDAACIRKVAINSNTARQDDHRHGRCGIRRSTCGRHSPPPEWQMN